MLCSDSRNVADMQDMLEEYTLFTAKIMRKSKKYWNPWMKQFSVQNKSATHGQVGILLGKVNFWSWLLKGGGRKMWPKRRRQIFQNISTKFGMKQNDLYTNNLDNLNILHELALVWKWLPILGSHMICDVARKSQWNRRAKFQNAIFCGFSASYRTIDMTWSLHRLRTT